MYKNKINTRVKQQSEAKNLQTRTPNYTQNSNDT